MKKDNLPSKTRYRPEIDGLRAFAVVAVIINHFNKEILPNGYLGVDIFFLISGFVITSSLYQRPSKNFKDFISGFYERRIKRLVPALSVFVLITSIAICFFSTTPGISLVTALTSLFGLSNIYLFQRSTDYFAQSTELNVFTHTWSLGVEEQFYIFFPFLIWFSGFGRQTKNGTRNLFLVVGALTIASLITFIYLYPINQSATYFLMPSRFWEMASGCLLFIGLQKSKYIEQLLEKVPPLLVLILIIGVMYLPISWPASIVAVVVLTSILITSLKKHTFAFKIFTHPKIVYIGLISYSLYLWHWGVLSISRWTIGIHWWSVPFQIVLMLGLAICSYRYIETPLRKGSWLGKRWKTFMFGGGILVTLSGCLITLGKTPNKILYLGNYSVAIKDDYSEHFSATREKCTRKKYSPSNCLIPSRQDSSQKLLLIGESHAGHIIPLIGEVYANSDIGINISTSGAYPKILESNNQGATKEAIRERIDESNLIFQNFVKEMRSGDIILLSSRWEHHLYEDFYNLEHSSRKRKLFSKDGIQITHDQAINIFENKLDEIADKLIKKGIKLVIFAPLPVFRGVENPTPAWACTKEWFRPFTSKSCNSNYKEKRSNIEERNKSIRDAFERTESKYSNVYIYDPFDLLCPSETFCTTIVDEKKIFRDDDHLSRDGARYLYKNFTEFLYTNNLLQSK
tara:strand:+ start:662 stop:2716 length:2055 start_codon:yes stop_codon:yes gene_type:complete